MIELLAPAGSLEKLKIAIIYGADAVFIGGQDFSLRARASNFSLADIKEATTFAHERGKKVYVTTNIIPHDEDLHGLADYLKGLAENGVDAIICASPAIIDVARTHTELEIHLSTQQSTLSTNAVNFWYGRGVKRIVLARELDLQEIKTVTAKTKADIEVFIHGGMCMSFSGRCSLSDNMTGRDANRGGCAHSCRWRYQLKEAGKEVSPMPFTMSSKDLQAIKHIPDLIDAGVASLKIEGRMKSLHYIATVVSTYRRVIDEYIKTGNIEDIDAYDMEISKAENRLTAAGFLEGDPGVEAQLFDLNAEKPSQLFIGLVKFYDQTTKIVTIEQRNHFKCGDRIEIFNPSGSRYEMTITEMTDDNGISLDVARHPQQIINIPVDFHCEVDAMVRKL